MTSKRTRSSNGRTTQLKSRTGGFRTATHPKSQGSKGKQASAGKAAKPKINFERYMALGQAVAAAGNEIDAEHYYQHAEPTTGS